MGDGERLAHLAPELPRASPARATGCIDERPALVVAHADRDDTIRIITARPATPAERKIYEEG
ncbi:MAG: hypothetical protein DMD87_24165 [Candidatus Rokuibacteriota bacterium]|nr:MAG: hypothetical protein DMD87_24165 [Candidatus Rokubacteria bacterium]